MLYQSFVRAKISKNLTVGFFRIKIENKPRPQFGLINESRIRFDTAINVMSFDLGLRHLASVCFIMVLSILHHMISM